MQVWCPSDHSYCQSIGPPRRHFRHDENGSRLRFFEISRKIPRYRAKNTVLGTYRRKPVDFRARRHPNLKGGMSSSPEIHGFSPGGFQYGVFRISVRIPNSTMVRMSPRASHFLAVDVVRLAPNLHMFNSTHQDLSFHGECLSISYGITPYCVKNRRSYGQPYRTLVPPLAVGDRQTFSV